VSPVTAEMEAARRMRAARGDLTVIVLYDERCDLCRKLRDWLGRQGTLNEVEFVAADSDAAHRRFPDLDHIRSTRVLTAITSDGRVYEGERAWLLCAWVLPAWRPVAEHASTPLRRFAVRIGGGLFDVYRHRYSCGDECRATATVEVDA
jgi:predicted DCC family thiol-disulfide oxidoreductase YuxK